MFLTYFVKVTLAAVTNKPTNLVVRIEVKNFIFSSSRKLIGILSWKKWPHNSQHLISRNRTRKYGSDILGPNVELTSVIISLIKTTHMSTLKHRGAGQYIL